MESLNIKPLRTNKDFKDLSGETFGFITIVGFAGGSGRSYWYGKCICGNTKKYRSESLQSGKSRSCGCQRDILGAKARTTHGMSNSPEARIYQAAKARCNNENDPAFKNYGGRGILFKFNTLQEFITDVGIRPSKSHSLDRLDNEGHYEPGNVKWVTGIQQHNNTRRNSFMTIDGESKTIAQWANHDLTTQFRIRTRFKRLGWCAKCSVYGSTCPHKNK